MGRKSPEPGVSGWCRHKRYSDRVTATRETSVQVLTMLRLLHREVYGLADHWRKTVAALGSDTDPVATYARKMLEMYAGAEAWIEFEMSKIPVRVFDLSSVRQAERQAFDVIAALAFAGRPKGGSDGVNSANAVPGKARP